METIFEIVVVTIFSFVGAFCRWIFCLCKKPYKYFKDKDPYFNGMLGLGITTLIITLLVKYITAIEAVLIIKK